MFNFKFASPKTLRKAGIIGINQRNNDYIAKYNKRKLFPLVDNKLLTKQLALANHINVPKLYGTIETQHDIQLIDDIIDQHQEFVIKPAQGSGGKGILVIQSHDKSTFTKASGETISRQQLERYLANLLGGLFSLGGKNDVAMIEEKIHFDQSLENYSYQGIPDLRIIVFKGFPIMAMLRCATKRSDGKANLHQGAIGVGISIQNGHAIHAIQEGQTIKLHPDTKANLLNIKIPQWQQALSLASECWAMVGLDYFGADIIINAEQKAMLLELNARPGLAIQLANQQGLAHRLNRLEAEDSPSNYNFTTAEKLAYSQQYFK